MLINHLGLPRAAAIAVLALVAALLTAAPAFSQYPLTSGKLSLAGGAGGKRSSEPIKPGAAITLAGGGFQPGARVEVWLHSDPIHLATVRASDAGAIDVKVKVPANAPAGRHTVQARGAAPGGGSVVLTAPIVVAAAVSSAAPATGQADPAPATAAPAQAAQAAQKAPRAPFGGVALLGVVLAGSVLLLGSGAVTVLVRGGRGR